MKENSTIEIVAIVNSFNRIELLRKALPSLTAALLGAQRGTAIVVYDAGSSDGSKEWIKEYIAAQTEIRIVLITPERGQSNAFSDGVNAGCATAAHQFTNSKFFFLFETDNWIGDATPLIHAIELLERHSDLAAAGFTVSHFSGSPARFGCRFPSLISFIVGPQAAHNLGLHEPPALKWRTSEAGTHWAPCDVVYTSPLLIRRTTWQDCGGLDAVAFPFSDCDLDLAWRLKKAELHMAVISSDRVIHDNLNTNSDWSSTRVLHFHRARLKLLRRHLGARVALVKPLLVLRHLAELGALALLVLLGMRSTFSLGKRKSLLTTALNDYETL